MEKNQNLLRVSLDTLLVVAIIALVILATPLIIAQFNDKPTDIQEIVNSCSNSSLLNASSCALNITKGFYSYNVENVGKDLTFSELRDDGGVCSNWSEYYSQLGEKLGYNSENIFIKINEGLYHEFSVWSNEDEYCILDQTQTVCFEFGTQK